MRFLSIGTDSATTLSRRHAPFLQMVRNQGPNSGVIELDRIDNNVIRLRISNAAKKGAMSGRMMNDLASAIDEIIGMETDKPSCVVISGSNSMFCSGADFELATSVLNSKEGGIAMCNFMTDALTALRNSDMLSLCVINGPALGGGAEITTSCDFRIIAKQARICFVHAKVGASPGWGGGYRLSSIVGRHHALRLLCGSVEVKPTEALSIGLVDDIFNVNPEDDMNEATDTIALQFLQPFLQQPFQVSVRGAKAIVAAADEASYEKCRNIERRIFGSRWAGKDNIAAIDSFYSKKNST